MYSKKIEKLKDNIKLTQNQREILVGLMLGDGHLETQNNGKTFRLKIGHSTAQTKYVNWLYKQFEEWVLTPPQEKQVATGGKHFVNIWFNTISHASFRFYGQQFYRDGKKVVPKMINKLLTPKSLAIWFMDDGSLKSKEHKALILNTQCFSKSDIEKLQKTLMRNWGVESQQRKQSDGIQLLIAGDSAIKFAKIIIPDLLPEFNYKLGKIGLTLLPKL
jgi:recombination protein RecA